MIKSVEKVLAILAFIAQNGNNARLQDIAQSLNLGKATVHSFLKTLVALGYVEQDILTPRYRVTSKMQFLTPPEVSIHLLKTRYKTILESITSQTGETSYLTVQMGTFIRHELKCEPERSVRISLELGRELDVKNSALGNVFMAHSPDLKNLLLRGVDPAEHAVWEDRLRNVIEKGFAEDYERAEKELHCIAVPVFERERLVAAIGVSGPSYRFGREEMFRAAQMVMKAI